MKKFLVPYKCWPSRDWAGSRLLVVLHSDNGSPMKASSFLVLLEKLGVSSSFSRPRVSNDNPYSESLFRTCKYRPDYPYKGFGTLQDARKWMSQFVYWYNEKHRHSGLQFVTPRQRHEGSALVILEKRRKVYVEARSRHPERWARGTRNWALSDKVALNPIKEDHRRIPEGGGWFLKRMRSNPAAAAYGRSEAKSLDECARLSKADQS
ncbi:transposase [Heliobacillus mobilis]|uniref:Transposase n=1 Tax=Heliobacterium mobile TaxID=28064 RepID=A0A6I3SPM4_HELMO|nr:transposase [Heliobacterium mobile]